MITDSYLLDDGAGGVRITCGIVTMVNGAASETGISGHSDGARLLTNRETLGAAPAVHAAEWLGATAGQIDFASAAGDDGRIEWCLVG